MEDTGDTK